MFDYSLIGCTYIRTTASVAEDSSHNNFDAFVWRVASSQAMAHAARVHDQSTQHNTGGGGGMDAGFGSGSI